MAWQLSQQAIVTEEDLKLELKKERINKAVTLIQTHERARQSRLYFFDVYHLHLMRLETSKPGYKPPPPIPKEILKDSANQIQKAWNGYKTREWLKKRETERRLLIG